MVEVDESIGRPEPLLHLLAGHQLTRPLQQQGQHLKRLPAQLEFPPVLAQFARAKVNFINPEANELSWLDRVSHGIPTLMG
jgi:hypothetical protein